MTAGAVLKQYFGYDGFRAGQETVIDAIMDGRDCLGIMPTGAGKSLFFQVPALMMQGIVIVVSPLISLMKDQVNALTQAGVPAAFINSSLTERQVGKALANAERGAYKLIYVAPERLHTYDFMEFAANADIAMVTVDEAHCISQWGQDFRPGYLEIPAFIRALKKRPVVSAFTATATPRVKEDIVRRLMLDEPLVLVSGFDRPNLFFDVKSPKDKFSALLFFLEEKTNSSGIVYGTTRATVEEVADKLNKNGYKAARYHAGLSDGERNKNQEDFLFDRVQIMVATNAFGMGIDKSNVAFVVHYNMPKDMESYYQEAGRAGRDGEKADCLLLYSKGDVSTNTWLIHNAAEATDETKQANMQKLYETEMYCTTKNCLREYILRYFGESPQEKCEGCANCNTAFEETDITLEVQKIISCIIRMKERFGENMIFDVLKGKKNKKIMNFGLDRLPTFGISNLGAAFQREVMDYLLLNQYIHKTTGEFPIIKLKEKAREALKKDTVIFMKTATTKDKKQKNRIHTESRKSVDNDLLSKLKEARLVIARNQNMPAFTIFHDSTLLDMCAKQPFNKETLLDVSGVGNVKAEKYGDIFLEIINEHIKRSE